jgi:hypothetical protein
VLGKWGVDHLRKVLDDFETELQARGLSIESYDSIKCLYRDEIEFPLTELRKFLYKEPSEIGLPRSSRTRYDLTSTSYGTSQGRLMRSTHLSQSPSSYRKARARAKLRPPSKEHYSDGCAFDSSRKGRAWIRGLW